MSHFSFSERFQMSQGIAVDNDIGRILVSAIPGAMSASKATKHYDRNGTDWWIECGSGHRLSVDVKVRSKDYKLQSDDLALELWSDVERRIIGWTLRTDKRTDYILWFWQDTARWCLVPFPLLCAVFQRHRLYWSARYRHATQTTQEHSRQWKSECVYVPRREVWGAIYDKFGESYLRRISPTTSLQQEDNNDEHTLE